VGKGGEHGSSSQPTSDKQYNAGLVGKFEGVAKRTRARGKNSITRLIRICRGVHRQRGTNLANSKVGHGVRQDGTAPAIVWRVALTGLTMGRNISATKRKASGKGQRSAVLVDNIDATRWQARESIRACSGPHASAGWGYQPTLGRGGGKWGVPPGKHHRSTKDFLGVPSSSIQAVYVPGGRGLDRTPRRRRPCALGTPTRGVVFAGKIGLRLGL